MAEQQEKRLYRSTENRMIAGVAAGLADYFSVDVVLIRIVFVALAFADGIGILAYIILAIVVPNRSEGPEGDRAKASQEFLHQVGEQAKQAAKHIDQAVARKSWYMQPRNLIGALLVVLGVLYLLRQVFPGFFFNPWGTLWPLLIVIVGLIILFRK